MSDKLSQWCVFLPCSGDELWALPQNCVAEIITVSTAEDAVPEYVSWRGRDVPVLDLHDRARQPWRDSSGLIAVMLGLRGERCEYWAVALAGEGLGMRDIAGEDVEDAPELALPRSVGAFKLHGDVYQVPDLLELQREISAAVMSA